MKPYAGYMGTETHARILDAPDEKPAAALPAVCPMDVAGMFAAIHGRPLVQRDNAAA